MPPVSIATVNRGPPAAVWGYRRYQYLQVHAGPGNPWDGAASSACPCLCMPVHRMHPQGWECMLLHKHMDTLACADTCTGTQALAGLTTNGMGDHPAGCDPLPQPPESVLVQRSLEKAGSHLITPTTPHLLTTCWGPHVASPVAPTAPRGRNQIRKPTQRGRVICLWTYSDGPHHSLSIGLLGCKHLGSFPHQQTPQCQSQEHSP